MISDKCFTVEWFDLFRNQLVHKRIDKIILEKMIYALHLLERLKTNGLDFVLKSGTSLVLLIEEDNRFSIDIDIITKTNRKEFEVILDKVIHNSRFMSYELDEPAKSNFKQLQDGIRAFGTGYLMAGNFRIGDAIVAAARVAHLATKLLINNMSPIDRFNRQDINPLNIEHPDWNFLNKLKRQPDKSSFYYWHQTTELLRNQTNIT